MFRAVSDRLVSMVVPTVTAQGIWYTQNDCRGYCGPGTGRDRYQRRCHDSSGQCTPWVKVNCTC